MIYLLDNYDSFVFNLSRYFEELGQVTVVERNDRTCVDAVLDQKPAGIVISPGPSHPRNAGIAVDLVRSASGRIPVLGICLGHQAIGMAFGADIRRARRPRHGQTSAVSHHGDDLFRGLSSPFAATRYHSLVVEETSLPAALKSTAWADDGELMAIRHTQWPVFGLQFHPESILSVDGHAMLANFLDECGVEPVRGRRSELSPTPPVQQPSDHRPPLHF